MLQKKKFLQQLGDEKKFVHRKIAPPPLKYLMVRPLVYVTENVNVTDNNIYGIIYNLHVRLIFYLGKKVNSVKNLLN